MDPSMEERWRDSQRGVDCPFCGDRPEANEEWSKLATLTTSTLYLQKLQTYRGHSVLVFDARHVTRISELSTEEWGALSQDIFVSQRAIERVTHPDHVNLACLGNMVSHLHWHIIPRYVGDSRWGASIWTTRGDEMQAIRLSAEAQRDLARAIRAELKGDV